jgi:hypothetical protein
MHITCSQSIVTTTGEINVEQEKNGFRYHSKARQNNALYVRIMVLRALSEDRGVLLVAEVYFQ